jgi:FkbM family methyltransferase
MTMWITQTIKLLRKCLGDARWSGYETWEEKKEVFKILFSLRYKAEIQGIETSLQQKIFGFSVTGRTPAEMLYLFREIFLNVQYKFNHPNNSPTIVDAGANIGMAIFYFKKTFPNCSILAFEPNPDVFKILATNISRNKLTNVEIINAGLSDSDGEMTFYTNPNNSLISSSDPNRGGLIERKVASKKLSTYLLGKKFFFAKIDVEGAEWQIVQDLSKTNTIGNISQYIFEYHHNTKKPSCTMSEFLSTYESHGFGYNMQASFQRLGDFQDILISFYKKGEKVND